MYSSFKIASSYLYYYLTASNGKGHGVHSPFVFEFITKVLNDKTVYSPYSEVEEIRKRLLNDHTVLDIHDLGAGSSGSGSNRRTVASIARTAVKAKKFAQLIYRIAKFYQPSTVLEIGTSLGITTSYLARAVPQSKVVTMEGAGAVLQVAKQVFQNLQLPNVNTVEGNFNDTLPSAIELLKPTIALAFIDGNHRLQPTMHYFETILARTDNLSIVIVDDIHWSKEMEQAWTHCKDHPSVTLSIDLFFIGILIFRNEIREKQHFVIRF